MYPTHIFTFHPVKFLNQRQAIDVIVVSHLNQAEIRKVKREMEVQLRKERRAIKRRRREMRRQRKANSQTVKYPSKDEASTK